jgi:hypothetical protein
VSPLNAPQIGPRSQARILDSYGKLPLSFEANHGQSDGRVKFLSRGGGYTLFLTQDEAVLALRGINAKTDNAHAHERKNATAPHAPESGAVASTTGAVLRMKLRNANPAATITGMNELQGTSNYFIGNDPAKWRSNVPTYAKVKYEGIYSGIDLVYYGNQRQLEYDFIVAPGADPRRIAFDISGAQRIRQDERGDLLLKTGEGEIRWHRPVAYQEKDGARQEIAAHYSVTAANRVGFEVAQYDASQPLYIDPLIYSTFLGGSAQDQGNGIALDSAGNAYVVGYTLSTNFPMMNPLQPNFGGGNGDVFVAKINLSGSALVYSTYLGGSAFDFAWGIAVDSAGNAYITGSTCSTDFPTVNALQATPGGGFCGGLGADAFVSEINSAGSALVYSTYLGGSGSDGGSGIAVDSAGNTYVVGATASTDFPTKNPLQSTYGGGTEDAFVAKVGPSGSALVYSTYLGGSAYDYGGGIAVDSAGNAYVTGATSSTNFPTMNPLQPNYGGGTSNGGDAFVTELNASGSALVYSTYLGGSENDGGAGITVDSAGNAYVVGTTASLNFPTMNPLQPANGGVVQDAFVSKLNPSGTGLVYSTYLGGSSYDYGNGIAVDTAGNAYVAGSTKSTNFPLQSSLKPNLSGSQDAFVSRINPPGSALVYSTYLGGWAVEYGFGIALDSGGNAYVAGYTTSPNFPTTSGAFQIVCNGGSGCSQFGDGFVAKLFIAPATTTTLSSSLNPSVYGQKVTFTATVSSSLGPPPNGETVTFKQGSTVLGMGTLSGGSTSFSTSTLGAGTKSITAVYPGDATLAGSTSKAVSQVVNKATTTTALASSLNPSKFGQSVTFTATVAPQFGGTVTGNVAFMDGTTTLGSRTLSSGVAKFTTSTLATGTHTITATYNGNANFSTSSATLTQTVN